MRLIPSKHIKLLYNIHFNYSIKSNSLRNSFFVANRFYSSDFKQTPLKNRLMQSSEFLHKDKSIESFESEYNSDLHTDSDLSSDIDNLTIESKPAEKQVKTKNKQNEETNEDDSNETLSLYDLDSSKSIEPSHFKTSDEEIKYQIERCLGNLSPNFKANKTSKKHNEQNNNSKDNETEILNKSGNDVKSPSKNKKSSNYKYISPEEAIEIINKREYNIVSIDNEFFERSVNKVIEVGISIYNPNYQRFALMPHIPSIHFIIKEHLNLRNSAFVPDVRMNNITGQSIVIPICNIPLAMDTIFNMLGDKTCIVGHNVSGDINSFKHLGYSIPDKFKIIDTSNLWYSLVGTKNTKSSLAYILDKLSIPNAFLHNGANDAYYTLILCLMLASPEIRNNLIFRKKLTKQAELDNMNTNGEMKETKFVKDAANIDPTKPSQDHILSSIDNPPDFSNLPKVVAERRLRKWLKKRSKDAAKAEKIKKLGPPVSVGDMLFRFNMEDSTISRKHNLTDKPKLRKTKRPPVNKFFTPKAYNNKSLTKKLEQLTI